MLVRRGADNGALEPRPNLIDARDMVVMMMREQDQVEPPAGFFNGLDDRAGIGRIDDRGCARAAFAQQPGVVVLENRNRRCCDCHGEILTLVQLIGNGYTSCSTEMTACAPPPARRWSLHKAGQRYLASRR